MALKPQLSFSSGELDPILHDRVTLERFQNALATARNTIVGKTGSILSRFGRFNFVKAAYDNTPIRIYCPPNSGLLLECGFNVSANETYIRLYNLSGTLLHTYTEDDLGASYFSWQILDKLQFSYSKDCVYLFGGSSSVHGIVKLNLTSPYSVSRGIGVIPTLSWPGGTGWTALITGTGYRIDYAVTLVVNGEETESYVISNATLLKAITVGQKTDLDIDIVAGTSVPTGYQEVRIYQRPFEGAAFGYLGRTTNFFIAAGRIRAKFTDVGANPDFTHGLQKDIVQNNGFSPSSLLLTSDIIPGTGCVYQQRLIMGNVVGRNSEAILASRPGFQSNFYQDFPYSINSALNFKVGTSGQANVLRMIEYNGLVVFTSIGVFVSIGVLSPDNLALEKRGSWIIDETIPPLLIPGGMFFVEKYTGMIKQLVYSQEMGSYDSIDHSIFSSHLFKNRTIKSWAFQDGLAPLVIITFSDGTFATFTYNFEHQMKAWTRSDSIYPVEQVEGTGQTDLSFFVVNKNGTRYIEGTVPRYISPSIYASNPEAHLSTYGAFMDGMKIKKTLLNDSLVGTDTFLLTPVLLNNWTGSLTLTCGTSALFPNTADLGAVGTIFRFFNPKDKSKLDLTVISRNSTSSVVVIPSEEFPEEYASGFRLYLTHVTVTGLDHLEGELVAIMADGDVISSPYNDSPGEAPSYSVVQAGSIDLPDGYRSAITVVGRPIIADIKTLNISTVEQSPTQIESLNVNKLYVRTFESRGLFIENQFPEEKIGEVDGHSVADMQTLDEYYVPSATGIIGNRSKPNSSKRIPVTISGEWDSNGQIAIRQVDPLHFEILSIIADVEVLRRSDR